VADELARLREHAAACRTQAIALNARLMVYRGASLTLRAQLASSSAQIDRAVYILTRLFAGS
jgi:hypothetical protein